MFLEVEANGNIDETFNMMYRDVSSPREVFCVKYSVNGEEIPVQVKGWDTEKNAPCPAFASRVEESGDGTALLIYGGSGGLRMKPLEDETEWDLASDNQWGETHLVYPTDCFIVYTDQL